MDQGAISIGVVTVANKEIQMAQEGVYSKENRRPRIKS